MKIRILLSILLLCAFNLGFSQAPGLSDNSQISVLTCATGDQLYSTFGHTAIRVQDPVLEIDVVYNYGTFDFDQPNFYLNFVKGKMIYSLSRRSFDNFLFEYELEKRWVKEQILDLTLNQRNEFLVFLEKNYLPENRDYLYDPLLNNCSSITGDILEKLFGDAVAFGESHLEKQFTFRQLVRQFLNINSWSAFGIDLAFGSVVDREATVRQHMFLPYYTLDQLDNTTINGKPLVKRQRNVLDYSEQEQNGYFPLSPLFWFSLFLVFVAIITYLDVRHKTRSRWLDFSMLLISGLVGLVLLLLWVAADHTSTPYNYNILWAFPLNLVVAFILVFQPQLPEWTPRYFIVAISLIGLVLLFWIFGVQAFSPVLIPLFLALGIRYWYFLRCYRLKY
ncbi:DUF4105 domain-containing protein [Flagellimonas meridianipacifica]|uniref:Uncharacterized protein DUF4105 n=1 Tax=Flagellimonas meridianipacifica TaxID=1080225 RepID=A0A2T0M9J0_9FLAO|nr:DUF4105 domain-containing protein [Allomuricauda pacifica]PRX54140.1 uncharacterized protein DUF4105 [Allomuricauda pacifica]